MSAGVVSVSVLLGRRRESVDEFASVVRVLDGSGVRCVVRFQLLGRLIGVPVGGGSMVAPTAMGPVALAASILRLVSQERFLRVVGVRLGAAATAFRRVYELGHQTDLVQKAETPFRRRRSVDGSVGGVQNTRRASFPGRRVNPGAAQPFLPRRRNQVRTRILRANTDPLLRGQGRFDVQGDCRVFSRKFYNKSSLLETILLNLARGVVPLDLRFSSV